MRIPCFNLRADYKLASVLGCHKESERSHAQVSSSVTEWVIDLGCLCFYMLCQRHQRQGECFKKNHENRSDKRKESGERQEKDSPK